MGSLLFSVGRLSEALALALSGSIGGVPDSAIQGTASSDFAQASALPFEVAASSGKLCPTSPRMHDITDQDGNVDSRVRSKTFVHLSPETFAQSMSVSGEIRRASDGLFYVSAQVNGATVRFLVDTGATAIVLTKSDAARAGVLPEQRYFSEMAETASGKTAIARVKLTYMAAGPSERRNVDAVIASEGLGVSLLGQSWLTQLRSVMIDGDRMILR